MHNREIIKGLIKRGFNIQLSCFEEGKDIPAVDVDFFKSLEEEKNFKADETIKVSLIPPPAINVHPCYHVLYTTAETAELHEGFAARLTLFDEVWFPSKNNFDLAVKAGLNPGKMRVMPEGVDHELWDPSKGEKREWPDWRYTFFSNSDWAGRKGYDILLPAFLEEFNGSENVQLVLAVRKHCSSSEENQKKLMAEAKEIIARVQKEDPPKVIFLLETYSDDDLVRLYNAADCFVLLSRGEAWSLPAIQAAVLGKPCIVSAFGGHREYLNEQNSYLVKVDRFDYLQDHQNVDVDLYRYVKFAEPSKESARGLMRAVFEDQGFARRKGAKARADVLRAYTWDHACDRVANRLLDLELSLKGEKGLTKQAFAGMPKVALFK